MGFLGEGGWRERGRGGEVRRDKPLFQPCEFGNKLRKSLPVESRKGNPFSTPIQPSHIAIRPEKAQAPICSLISFHALERLEGVMEDAGCGIEGEVLVGGYSRGEPA